MGFFYIIKTDSDAVKRIIVNNARIRLNAVYN